MNTKAQSTGNYSATTSRLNMSYAAVICILLLVGCVTPDKRGEPKAVSLEEAKKITATFEGQAFTPPPRTINDITAILKQEKPEDMESFKKALALADSTPPNTTDEMKLAKFYFKRAYAAHEVGRANQEIEDYRLAVKYGEKSGFSCQTHALQNLCTAETRGGNLSRGIQVGERVLSEETKANRLATWNSVLAWMYAKIGDLDSARGALDRAEMSKSLTTSWTKFAKKWRDMMNSHVASGRGAFLDALGRLQDAEVQHIKAVDFWEPYKSEPASWECGTSKTIPRLYNWKVSDLADNLRRQGRLIEAEFQARRAVRGALRSHGLYSAHTGMMVSSLNKVIFEQGRFIESEVLAKANLDIYLKSRTARDSAVLANARSILADAILTQRRWKEALAEYDAIRTALKTDPAAYKGYIAQNVSLWLALIKGGRGSDALNLVRPAFERKKRLLGEDHYDTAETRGVLAMVLAATGDSEGAIAEFAKAIPILLDRSSRSEGGESTQTARDFRLGLILDAYIQLLAVIRGTPLEAKSGVDAAAEAFRLADVVRGRTVKRALAASSARAAAKDTGLADLARREQDALAQIGALNGLLSNVLSAPSDQQNPRAIENLRSRIDRLRSARAALMKEIDARFPDYANLVDPKPMSIEEARSNLRPGEALVATYVGDGRTYVWAIPHSGSPAFSSADLDANAINHMVSILRLSLNPPWGTLGNIPDFDLKTAYTLYEALLKPVEAGWKDSKNLLLVAHGALGFLPFSVLPTKTANLGPEKEPLFSNYRAVPWLARTHTVTSLPSVASLRTLRNIPTGEPGRKSFTGFGNPYFSPAQVSRKEETTTVASAGTTRGMPIKRRGLKRATGEQKEPDSAGIESLSPLPDTADEVRGIALALKADLERDVFLGKAASEEQVKSMNLSGVKVLAFATHGLLPGELDGLSQPALALSSPKVTGGRDDGLLTLGEILGLKLNADWVVLSACNTGAGEGAGAEAVSGLGRAFFYAGTRALLVSNWPVETTSAKTLTTELFRRQAAAPTLIRSEALNRTMLDLIDKLGYIDAEGRMVFSYAHPVFWAPFSLVGDGGR